MIDKFQKLNENFQSSSSQSSFENEVREEDMEVRIPALQSLKEMDGLTVKKNYASVNAVIETSLIVVCLIALFLLLPRDAGGDGGVRYQGLLQIVTQHKIPDMKYSLIGPAFALPLVWIGKKLGDPYDWAISYNQILFSFTLLVSFFLLRKYMDRALLRKFYLLLIIGSMFTAHLALFYGEVFTALLVGFGVLIASLRSDLPPVWLVVALGVANTPATLGGLALLVLKKVFDNKRLRYALVLLGALALIGLANWLQRGNPLNGGYTDDGGFKTIMPYSGLPGFSYPFFFGVLSLIFSFGKGLLFFAPGLILPVRKTLLRWQQQKQVQLYQVYTLWIAFIIGLILVYARWWAWYGGASWGPRFLLFASIPASFALAVRIYDRKEASLAANFLTLVIFVFSVWVCIDGAVYQWATAWHMPSVCSQNNYNLEMVCYYIPEFSALWLPFTQHYVLNIQQKLFLGIILFTATYIAFPLFLQIVWQSWKFFKKYGKEHFTHTIWRI